MLKRLLRRTPEKPPVITRRSEDKPATRWAAVMPPLGRKVTVVDIQPDTDQAVRLSLRPSDGGALNFRAGQYLTCCFDVAGQTLRRPYSICSVVGSELIEVTCKRVAQGQVSNYVCDQLAVGDEFEVRGPSGEFCLPDDNAPLFCLAAGSGITPIMSLIGTALQQNPKRAIHLLYANRNSQSALFSQQLEQLQSSHAQLQLTHVFSQAPKSADGYKGRLNGQRVCEEFAPPAEAQVFLCGPQALMRDVREQLLAAGHASERIHCEEFTPAARASQAHPSQPQTIVFKQSGQQIEQAPGQSILDAALAQGVAMDFSCTVGGCAACKVKLLEGDVIMDEPHCLSENECAQGMVLACSAYATQRVVLDA